MCKESARISYCGFFLTKYLTNWLRKAKGATSFERNPLIMLVRLAGIEPTTPWFVAKYSIQLSYSREKQNYSMGAIDFGSPIRGLYTRYLFICDARPNHT